MLSLGSGSLSCCLLALMKMSLEGESLGSVKQTQPLPISKLRQPIIMGFIACNPLDICSECLGTISRRFTEFLIFQSLVYFISILFGSGFPDTMHS